MNERFMPTREALQDFPENFLRSMLQLWKY